MKSIGFKIFGAIFVFLIGLFAPSYICYFALIVYGFLTRGVFGIIFVGLLLDGIYASRGSISTIYTLVSIIAILFGQFSSRYSRALSFTP